MEKNILSQLEFFELLSESFDQLISWPTRIGTEGMFFKKLVTDNKLKSSLDVACSTGFHVIMLRRLGLDASGIDVSPKMIQKAKDQLNNLRRHRRVHLGRLPEHVQEVL
jgi:SAM-dependent methyltransferase